MKASFFYAEKNVIHAVRNDSARTLDIEAPYPSGSTASFIFVRPDGEAVEESAVDYSSGAYHGSIPQEALAVIGKGSFYVEILDENTEEIVRTVPIRFEVERSIS